MRRTQLDLRGVPGARQRLQLAADRRDQVTFTGCILTTPPPPDRPDHFWMTTAQGSRTLLEPQNRALIEALVGLHDADSLGETLIASGHDRDSARRLIRSKWFFTVPGVMSPIDFTTLFQGRSLTRAPSQVAKPSPNFPKILLRTERSTTPVAVPGWLYSHMIGPPMRPDLVETVAWRIEEPSVIVSRITTVIDLLPRLLGDGIAVLTPSVGNASARLVDERAYGSTVQRLDRRNGEGLDWLLSLISKA